LAQIEALLGDEALLAPIEAHGEREAQARGRAAKGQGRPPIVMQTEVRLVVLEHRSGWGSETLIREVSDSLRLRRFCLIPIEVEVPDASTVRKLTRGLGPESVAELARLVLAKAQRETRFPTGSGLAGEGVRGRAREGRRLAAQAGARAVRVRDRSRAAGKRLRAIGRTLRRRSGEAQAEALARTGKTGRLLGASARDPRPLAAEARSKARALARPRTAKTRAPGGQG
jgi:IS5 family transposase